MPVGHLQLGGAGPGEGRTPKQRTDHPGRSNNYGHQLLLRTHTAEQIQKASCPPPPRRSEQVTVHTLREALRSFTTSLPSTDTPQVLVPRRRDFSVRGCRAMSLSWPPCSLLGY